MDAPRQQAITPRWVWHLGLVLGAVRLGAYFVLATPRDVAQWQLAYIPLWLADLPCSLLYFFIVPAPTGEALVGPIWWTLLPYFVARLLGRRVKVRGAAPRP
jgi:hypothetical protein